MDAENNAAALLCHAAHYEGDDGEAAAPLPPGHFRNPVLPGCHPDPSICRIGNDYYLATSTFATFPGIALHHSRDLVHWRPIGHAVIEPGHLPYAGLGISRGLFAPALSHHNGRCYLVCTMVGGGDNFVITAEHPAGPWSAPQWLEFEGIDPALFFDDDGSAWILNNGAPEGPPRYRGHRAIWLQAFDVQALRPFGPRRVLVDGGVDPATQPIWIEGPHLYRHRGWYFLCAAEGGTAEGHSQVLLRSRHVTGPYEPWAGNPTLTQRDLDGAALGAVTCTGHADLVTGPDGQWWAVFLGCRPLPAGHHLLGRETFVLPVQWTEDDWPLILPRGQRVPLVLRAPEGVDVAGAAELAAPVAHWRDDFRGPTLAPTWLGLRAPPPVLSLGDQGLRLRAGADGLHTLGEPAVLLHRVQHRRFTATLELAPPPPGVRAGLVLFQSEAQHDLLWLQAQDGGLRLGLSRRAGGVLQQLAEQTLPASAGPVQLRVRADEHLLHYEAACGNGPWQPLAGALEHGPLSVQAAGGGNHFTGLLWGLHAALTSAGS
jgi:alpha-N-arabinofuranosidase